MRTEIQVCDLGLLEGAKEFWIGDTSNLSEKFIWTKLPHKNTFYSILFLKGIGDLEFDGARTTLTSNSILLIKPSATHSLFLDSKSEGVMLAFSSQIPDSFDPMVRSILSSRIEVDHFKTDDDTFNRLEALLKIMSTEVARPGNKSLMHSYLQLLLKEIYRDIKLNDSSKTVFFKNDLINKFSQLLSENFSSKRKPSEYAKLLGVTPNYLNRICKEELNCTAGDLIREKLISESKQLLAYTSLSITEIAEKLGFENTSYFVTMFKREAQITPEQFRKRSRETDTN